MATAAAIGEVWQVTVRGKLEGQDCQNVMAFKCVNASSNVETDLLAALITCFVLHLIPVLSGSYRLESARGKQVSPILGPEIEVVPGVGEEQEGQGTGDGLPSFVSNCISVHTTRGGKSGRGRIYIGGIVEGDTTQSSINTESATWTAIAAFIACVAGKFLGDGFNPSQKFSFGVISRKLGGPVPPYNSEAFARYTNMVPHPALGTTRSRKIGHGT